MNAVLQRSPSDAELASALANTAREVFRLMLDADIVECGRDCAAAIPHSGVVAVLSFTGSCTGAGLVWCSPDTACKLAGRMLMSEFDTPGDEVLDAIGEIANMIVGNVKSDLEPILGPLSLGTPTVIYGAEYRARKGSANCWITVALEAGDCPFLAAISLADGKTTASL